MYRANMPVALTIAGSDSGGEAGIQADLKAFALLGVHGTTAITCLTAQNPRKIARLEPCPPSMVRAQLDAVAAEFSIGAAKTGMLFSAAIVRVVAQFFQERRGVPLVVDPVMISTSGRRLLQVQGVKALQRELLPLAALVTPNLAEAEMLSGRKSRTLEEMRGAARAIYESFGCGALVKGGHLAGTNESVDIFYGKRGEWMFSAPRAKKVALHGAGCTYSAAITAWLARGRPLMKAIELGKEHVTRAIYESRHSRMVLASVSG